MRTTRDQADKDSRPKTFKAAFCEHFRCPPDRFEESLFRRGLFRHAVPIAFLIHRFDPAFFDEDRDMIREVGAMTKHEIFRHEINYFFGRNLREKNWLRRTLRIRVSGNRLIRLWRRVMLP